MIIRNSTKTTTIYNISPFPSFITNKTKHRRNGNQAHTQTNTNLLPAQKKGRQEKNKDINRTWKTNIPTSTKTTTKYNILPFHSVITNKTPHKRNGNQEQTKTNTNLPPAQKNGRSR